MADILEPSKQTVSTTEQALEAKATRVSDAEVLAVERHQKINLIWERTQQFIALLCVIVAVLMSVYIVVTGAGDTSDRAYQFLTNSGLLVIGFYFGRTNHTRPTGEEKDKK